MYRQHRTWIIPFRIQHMASSWQIPVKLNDNIDILCCMFLGDNNWQEGKDWPFIIFTLFSETFISVLKGRRKTWKSRSFLESRSLYINGTNGKNRLLFSFKDIKLNRTFQHMLVFITLADHASEQKTCDDYQSFVLRQVLEIRVVLCWLLIIRDCVLPGVVTISINKTKG